MTIEQARNLLGEEAATLADKQIQQRIDVMRSLVRAELGIIYKNQPQDKAVNQTDETSSSLTKGIRPKTKKRRRQPRATAG